MQDLRSLLNGQGSHLVQRSAIIGFLTAVVIGNLVLLLSQPRTTSARPDPADHRPIAERFSSQKVSTVSELTAAAAAVGLTVSRRTVGRIERITRIDERDVALTGWLADRYGDATALTVMVFVAGTMAGTTRTEGERPDVAALVGLGFGAEKHVNYRVSFACRTGDQPIVVGLGPREQYIPLVLAHSVPPQCP
jgi:MFS family permease